MFDKIIAFSVRNKLIMMLFVLALVLWGGYSASQLSIDAVPDITNNQVQIVTVSPSLAAQEVEQFITYPIELKMANLQAVEEIRSISRYGLSIVTIVFEENYPMLDARQLVSEYLTTLGEDIPSQLGTPELMPITTGLGEVYQYTLEVSDSTQKHYTPMELRTIQDWLVKRQLSGIEGVVEISSFGGFLKQYEIEIDPDRLNAIGMTVNELFAIVERNNENSGGSYIEKGSKAYYVRTEGLVQSIEDIKSIVVKHTNGIPLTVGDIAQVKEGYSPRFGALTRNGKGESVGGILLMLKGENAYQVVQNIEERVNEIASTLPEGVKIVPYLDRGDLVTRVINTVKKNLIEGGLIVVFVLILLLGNWRAGLVVASVIPLSLLFAFSLMNIFGISANLMSLGAIDFGIVVDGSVIIVEAVIHRFHDRFKGKLLDQKTFDDQVIDASQKIRNSAAFGEIIILIVYLPILVLSGIEGKTFTPMAQTVSFAILGAFILSMTYVPMMSSLVLSKNIVTKATFADKIIAFLKKGYEPLLHKALKIRASLLLVSLLVLAGSIWLLTTLGAVFIPTLGEGDMALQMTISAGSNLEESIATTTKIEQILIHQFPEVQQVVSKIGTAEVPTDPMAMENADIMIIMAPQEEWTSASTREEMAEKMKEALSAIIGVSFEFTQPIQLRFNELITGSKSDLAIKIYGDDLSTLSKLAEQAEALITPISGAADVKAERLEGLPQLMIKLDREKIAKYGLDIHTINQTIETAFAGRKTSTVYENEQRFDLVIRLANKKKADATVFNQLFVRNPHGEIIPISELASIGYESGPMQVSRENTNRRISIGVNVRNRDIKSLVDEIDATLQSSLTLPPGYRIEYGGDFKNLQSATQRLAIAVPIALLLIFILLFFAFKSIIQSIMIFTAIPLASIGGILALWLRDMPFSISAGIGFIALFGVAVLNGIVLIAEFNDLKQRGISDLKERVIQGSLNRLRPVLMTASVAAFGFIPMALSSSAGAEVQQPLATVVIGGLITSTILTLVLLPLIYSLVEERTLKVSGSKMVMLLALLGLPFAGIGQTSISLDSALQLAKNENIQITQAEIEVQKAQVAKSGAWSLGKTNVLWQRGQINTAVVDNSFSVTQSLGNPFADATSRSAANSAIATQELQKMLTQKEVLATIKTAYYHFLLTQKQYKSTQLLTQQYDDMKSIADIRYEAGEITQADALLLTRQQGELAISEIEYNQQLNELLLTFNLLLNQNGIAVQPDSIELEQQQSIPELSASEQSTLVQLEQQRLSELKKVRITQQMQYFPQFSVGYFSQEIEGTPGFDGFTVGVSIPLWFLPEHSNAQQAKLNQFKQEEQLNYAQRQSQAKMQVLYSRLTTLEKQLEYYTSTALPQAEALLQQARAMSETGDQASFQLLESFRQANLIQINYYETLKSYYTSLFELEIYQ